MIRILASGTPYQIGYAHGQATLDLAWESHRQYVDFTSLSEEEINRMLIRVESNHHAHFPALLEEMRGIADGAQMPYREVLMLNFFPHIVGGEGVTTGCSTIGLAETEYGPLLGKTIDGYATHRPLVILQTVKPTSGYSFMHYGYPGTIWVEAGINSAGLAMANTGVCASGVDWDGVCYLALMRAVLQHCATVEESLHLCERHGIIKKGGSMLLADRSGDLVLLEKVPFGQGIECSERGYVFHTNHCVCKETVGLEGTRQIRSLYGCEWLLANSQSRYENLSRQVPCMTHTLDALETLLQDHSQPGAICQHGPDMCTFVGMVLAPEKRKLWGTDGPPCQQPFVEYSL